MLQGHPQKHQCRRWDNMRFGLRRQYHPVKEFRDPRPGIGEPRRWQATRCPPASYRVTRSLFWHRKRQAEPRVPSLQLNRCAIRFSSPLEGEERRARTCTSKCALARQGEGNVLLHIRAASAARIESSSSQKFHSSFVLHTEILPRRRVLPAYLRKYGWLQ